MIRVVTGGLIVLPFVGLLSTAAAASTEFEDIPFLQVRINQVLEHEPTGAEVEWHNEATGNSGVIRVLKTYFPEPGAPCRNYERSTRDPDGGEKRVRGTGCRDASGRWNLKEQEDSEAPGSGAWAPVAPSEGAAAPSGGPTGATGGQGSTPAKTEVQGGATGQAAGTSPSQTSQPTSVAPKESQGDAATESAADAAADAATPPAAKPAEPAKPTEPAKPSESSPPDYDLPTPSD